jgi:hypothetical protein
MVMATRADGNGLSIHVEVVAGWFRQRPGRVDQ